MKNIIINNIEYVIEKDEFNIVDKGKLEEMITDYFDKFDYIFGDIAYDKLRLKGFCDSNNKDKTKINDIKFLDDYIENYCAYGCKWFLLKKIK